MDTNVPPPPADESEVSETATRTGRRRTAAIVAGLLAVGVIAFLFSRPAPDSRKITALPPFELEVLGADRTISNEDLTGRPAVVNFWASWCAPCRREAPALEAAWQRYKDEGVMFLGVDVRDIESQAERFVREEGLTYESVRDPDQVLVEAMNLGDRLPQTFFVYPDGRLLSSQGIYEISGEELELNIEALLEPAPSDSVTP